MVVARAAAQCIGGRIASQDIVVSRAVDVLDVGQHVAGGITAKAGAGREIDGHARCGRGVDGLIDTGPAIEVISARAAGQVVVSGLTTQCVGVAVTGQNIVVGRAFDVLHVGQDVARRITTETGSGGQVNGHTGRRLQVRGDVGAGAAIDGIGATGARDVIVAAERRNDIRARGPDDCVVALGRPRAYDLRLQVGPAPNRAAVEFVTLDDGVGISKHLFDDDLVAADTDIDDDIIGVGRRDRDHQVGGRDASAEHDLVGATAVRLVDDVGAVADGEGIGVVAGTAAELVISGIAGKSVGTGVSGEGVVVSGSLDILDAQQCVARRVTAGRTRRREIDRHASARLSITCRIDPDAAVERIRAGAAGHHVVAGTSRQNVSAGFAD